jgi:iron complex transport system ATP-binding protein
VTAWGKSGQIVQLTTFRSGSPLPAIHFFSIFSSIEKRALSRHAVVFCGIRMSLRVEHIFFSYPNLPVLRDVSFELRKGDFLSLLGPNGSGKSTLLRLLDRILLPQRGTITLQDRPLQQFNRKEIARIIAYVPQDTLWVFPFTVLEVVLMGRSPYVGRSGFESRHDLEVTWQMMKLTQIDHLADKPITAISGGERQRVLIARALSQQPQILLLDEPNAHLDICHQVEIFQILRDQNELQDLAIVSVSHDLNLAAAFSKKVMLLAQEGAGSEQAGATVVSLGTPAEVLTESNIQRVYRTPVLVDQHPRSFSPRISLILSGSEKEEMRDPRGG